MIQAIPYPTCNRSLSFISWVLVTDADESKTKRRWSDSWRRFSCEWHWCPFTVLDKLSITRIAFGQSQPCKYWTFFKDVSTMFFISRLSSWNDRRISTTLKLQGKARSIWWKSDRKKRWCNNGTEYYRRPEDTAAQGVMKLKRIRETYNSSEDTEVQEKIERLSCRNDVDEHRFLRELNSREDGESTTTAAATDYSTVLVTQSLFLVILGLTQ